MTAAAKAWVRGVIPDSENRERDDFYPTPASGTRALLGKERFYGPIWEPACGNGAISNELICAGYQVESTDLVVRGYGQAGIDFLMEWQPRAPNIVTNPPFKFAEAFVQKALQLTTAKVCILARLAFLEGKGRQAMFESTPLARIWVFSKRLTILRRGEATDNGGGMIAFAWYVWEHGHEGPPTIGWVEPVEAPEAA